MGRNPRGSVPGPFLLNIYVNFVKYFFNVFFKLKSQELLFPKISSQLVS